MPGLRGRQQAGAKHFDDGVGEKSNRECKEEQIEPQRTDLETWPLNNGAATRPH